MTTQKHSESPNPIVRTGNAGVNWGQPVSPEMIDQYVRLGYQLRSKAVTEMSQRLTRRIGAFFRRGPEKAPEAGEDDPQGLLAHHLITPLSAIRSSAEILRDNPGIDSRERQRFVDIVLAEEARLESLLSRMISASDRKGRGRLWQVPLDQLKLGHGSAPP